MTISFLPALLFEDIMFYFELVKWLILIYLSFWLYNWTRDKLGFSQVATFAVAGILIYFLIIEHPIIGSLGIFTWITLTGGILYVLGLIPYFGSILRGRH